MADSMNTSRDPEWYRTRWDELTDLLPASSPEEVIDRVRDLQINMLDENAEALSEMGLPDAGEAKRVLKQIFERLQALRRENQSLRALQTTVDADSPEDAKHTIEGLKDRVDTLEEKQAALVDAGFENPEHAAQAIASMKHQLEELYGEKEATERNAPENKLDGRADTFGQLQALLAREEELQRELGVASPDAVIRMVEGLTDQLEDLYRDRDAEASSESPFASSSSDSPPGLAKLKEELGVADPDAIIAMVNDLTRQLDELYTGQERLAELNLTGVDDAIAMIQDMQRQLESVYQRREKLSENGIDGIDHALSMIESMESQLSELYDERERLADEEVHETENLSRRIEELEEKLEVLADEKDILREKRDRLQSRLDEFKEELGTDDPETLSDLVGSLERQLDEVHRARSDRADHRPGTDESLLPEETLQNLPEMADEALDELPVGVFAVDEDAIIRRVNRAALNWPDASSNDPDSLLDANFFQAIAPGANSALFHGRFEDALGKDSVDERFLYTYVSKAVPPCNLAVQLYRPSRHSLYWILFQVR